MLAINLKRLQANARRKLQLKGPIEWRLAKSEQACLGNGFLSTRSAGSSHIIAYSDASSLSDVDVYHELCRAKLYEMEFSPVEMTALDMIRECSKNDPKYIRDANSAVAIVMETFANTFLFLVFRRRVKNRAGREVAPLRI